MISYKKFIAICFVLHGVLLSGCLKNDDLNQPFVSYEPVAFEDGLIRSSAAAENVDPEALTEIYHDVYTDDNLWSLRSLLVFRNGKLIAESYPKSDLDITTKHLVWSCTKQVMGILTGKAIENGLINDLDDPISDYLAFELNNHQDKNAITIRNLITMQSGIDYDNEGVDGETDKLLRQIPNNSVEFILKRPLNAIHGTEFHYNDGNPHLISALVQKLSGQPTDEWAKEVLFSEIGMTNFNWVRYKDGIALGGFGIETTPREMAKIALLVSNNGSYNGNQIINSAWIGEMISKQVDTDDADFSFGYFWWIDNARDIPFMWGHGGQFAFIVPSKNLVIVMTSIPNTQGDDEIHANEALPVVDRIINASF